MRISDWSSDVCSSDLEAAQEFCSHFDLDSGCGPLIARIEQLIQARNEKDQLARANRAVDSGGKPLDLGNLALLEKTIAQADLSAMTRRQPIRSEEHTSELQTHIRHSYAAFRWKK